MGKDLVIVESPAKAKTIQRFLGEKYIVKSSYGHIRDLSEKDLSIDINNGFAPIYVIPPDKKAVVKELKSYSSKSDTVLLATDEDREGEAISWHLKEVLELDDNKTKRIVFHEITKETIIKAIKEWRTINMNLVKAQQARRVLDRLVGFELSPLLWKKIKPALSAGRVQSVAVRLIVEREKEINSFKETKYYRVTAKFSGEEKNKIFDAELSVKINTKEEVIDFLNKCINAQYHVANIEIKPAKQSPPPPFTTSTLQQEASRKLGFSVAKTMMVAQQLYEAGYITYMRTDSVNLSDMIIAAAKKEITKLFGQQYSKPRKYKTKTLNAQEAHEAIRPTYINNRDIDGDISQKKLYDLIWKRTIASQMEDASLEKTNITISISNSNEHFIAKGEVIKFDGFLKLYKESSEDDNSNSSSENILPKLKLNEKLINHSITCSEEFTHHPPRYSEASLVKKLEELGIGRPSTYAPTISTIIKREYVVKESREGEKRKINIITLIDNKISETQKEEKINSEKNKLFPTDIGILVNDFLKKHFNNIIEYDFTAKVEKEFDKIARGEKEWNEIIKDFYSKFHPQVENIAKDKNIKASNERFLGIDPKTNKKVVVKIGRYGPVAMLIGEDDQKPVYSQLRKNQLIETITLEEALELFELPKQIGIYKNNEIKNNEIIINTGRFGPYIKYNSQFYSIPKDVDIHSITVEEAIKIIETKEKGKAENNIKELEYKNKKLYIIKGKYGPYISYNNKNYKIPKNIVPENITIKECEKIISKEKENKEKNTKTKKTKK